MTALGAKYLLEPQSHGAAEIGKHFWRFSRPTSLLQAGRLGGSAGSGSPGPFPVGL